LHGLRIGHRLGAPTNVAIQKYLNGKRIPNLYLTFDSERFNDPMDFPWIIPFFPI
jgi:branched-chain amino acid transport system substrate-binding protein